MDYIIKIVKRVKESVVNFISDIPNILNNFLNDLCVEIKKPFGFLYLILGFFWIAFFVGLRFFRNLTGYNIIELRENSDYTIFVGFVFFVFVNFAILFYLCYSFYKKKYNRPTSKYFEKIASRFSSWVTVFFWRPLYVVYAVIHKNVIFSGMIFEFLERNFFYHPIDRKDAGEKYYYSYFFIFLLDILPRVGTAFVFFIEVVFFCRVHYFLYCLPLLLLPVLLKIFLQLMHTYGKDGYVTAHSYLKTIRVPEGSLIIVYGRFKAYKLYVDVYIKDEYLESFTPLSVVQDMIMLSNLVMQAYFIRREIKFFSEYVLWVTSALYFLGGLFRLFLFCNFF